MLVQDLGPKLTLYGGLAETIESLIQSGTFREGERIPSIRTMSRQFGVSVNTVREAYWVLETRRVLEGRPQSGYFVRRRAPGLPTAPDASDLSIFNPHEVLPCSLREELPPSLAELQYQGLDLARATPDLDLLPAVRLNAFLGAVAREAGTSVLDYDTQRGWPALRNQVARISLEAGVRLSPDDFLITSGCIPAITLAISVLCRPGDTIAIESPCYSEFLRLFDSLEVRVLEIPSSSEQGLNLEVLEWALDRHPVKAVLAVPTFNNPTGSCMPEHRKKALVEMLTHRNVPLIEDDAYGELSFLDQRPPACKAFDTEGIVIYCSSVSKTLAPGYRLGWLAGGRWHEALVQRRRLLGVSASAPAQIAVARFLERGNYARHLRSLRRRLAEQNGAASEAVASSFPPGTKVARPLGGLLLWVEVPEGVNTEALYPRAASEGVFYRPGVVYSASGKLENFLRLGTGTWNPGMERAIHRLGQLVGAADLAARGHPV